VKKLIAGLRFIHSLVASPRTVSRLSANASELPARSDPWGMGRGVLGVVPSHDCVMGRRRIQLPPDAFPLSALLNAQEEREFDHFHAAGLPGLTLTQSLPP
jgi:hypothetical protein